MARRRQKGEERAIALDRIARLLALAAQRWPGRPDLADRYAALAARLATRYQTGLAPAHRARVCRACHAFLGPGRTRVRLTGGRVSTTCLACGDVRRRPLAARVRKERGAKVGSKERGATARSR